MKKYKIVWSPLAEEKYLEIIAWLIENWSLKAAEEFEAKVESLLYRLSVFKNLCPASKAFNTLRRCVITPQTSLIYELRKENVIEIVAFFDNRSNHKF
jgi:plasmid stabilization system protein ParE